MIYLLADSRDAVTTELVQRAFERSFTRGQVRLIDCTDAITAKAPVVIALAPDEALATDLQRVVSQGGKLLLLGKLGPRLAALAGVTVAEASPDLAAAAVSAPAPSYATAQSRAALRYARTGLGAASPLHDRRLCRFDFTNEWNNLGYGRIGIGPDRWSIGQLASHCDQVIAELTLDDFASPGAAVTLRDWPAGAVLWFARPVGPIDGPDWAVVERFIADYRAAELSCRPFLRDIPHGYGAAVTMRLDCDEDIASARPLLELYRDRGRPLSLAIKTDQPCNPAHLALIGDLRAAGGSILSHSVSHAPNWGGSAEAAEREARDSKSYLESRIDGLTVRYAVSPFHQNPTYVPAALARAGYDGFVGGIIANDPEYMMARAGQPPFSPEQIISHTQGCMLHGDCMLSEGDPLRMFKTAFSLARDGGQFFGYLDHPFSERYAYGWASEPARVAAHGDFLDYIEQNAGDGPLLFVNEDTALDFIKGKAAAEIAFDEASDSYRVSATEAAGLPLSIGFRGRVVAAR
ncbi:hypothetical protein [Rhodopseudomonas palustris]|uniref:Polysaccharide deacetylase n=1 Tax=Rhodopseudomonas palustris (strain BisB18) TaxID=316056 RepID=Q20YR0_RHOPB